ncbi:NAD(P)/FAD-dependent oxidoreductase [candidate division KSB1 bacterium]|nr:NAD(P)/FAD-dependent oxidoreductase [candidate division KSB1 bacterium]
MNNRYDVVVVGAGPAGSTSARFAAQSGASVLLLEKDREIGIPVRCAEGVGEKGLKTVVDIRPHWIKQKIVGVIFHSPSGKVVKVQSKEIGYVLDRKIFDYELAQIAAEQGAHVATKANVLGLLKKERVCGVVVDFLGERKEIAADIVIGADGIESRVGRWAGIKTHVALYDIETCAQVTAMNIPLESDYCHFFFGKEIAPGGYLWVFPKGNGLANVGLGISGEFSKTKPAIRYLEEFLSTHFPAVAVLTTVAGGVTCAPPLKTIVEDGLLLVGDAAHQTNPVSGGGIVNAMVAAKIAGRIAGQAIKENNVSKKRLMEYPRLWDDAEGKKLGIFYKLKKFIYDMTDNDLEKTADLLLGMPMEKRTLVNIFKSAVVKQPSLIIDILKVFT